MTFEFAMNLSRDYFLFVVPERGKMEEVVVTPSVGVVQLTVEGRSVQVGDVIEKGDRLRLDTTLADYVLLTIGEA